MIELRHLRYFLETVRLRHVTRAADALHVTQSTLSHQLRQLEGLVGTPLFERVGRGIRPTEAGETFAAYARRALLEVDEGRVALQELRDLARGRLRVGAIHTYNTSLLPQVIVDYAREHPGVHLLVEDLAASAIERDVAAGDLDLGLAFAPAARDDVVAEPLFAERLVIVVRRDHPLAGQRSLPARRLADVALIVQTERFSSRALIDQALGQWIAGSVRMEMSSIDAMLNTARLLGIAAVVFERAVAAGGDLVAIPITRPAVQRTAALVWSRSRTRSAAALRMADAIRAHCARLAGVPTAGGRPRRATP